ncbi:hypothetical protein HN51_047953 [Arachis hypogaea]
MKSASLVCHRIADAELQGDRSSWSCSKGSFLEDDDSTAAAMKGHQNVQWYEGGPSRGGVGGTRLGVRGDL